MRSRGGVQMNRVRWGVGLAVGGLAACGASVPPPRVAEASTAAAVSSARQAGAARDARALPHLDLAEEQLENGRALMREGDNRVAAMVLGRAKSEADIAASIAHEKRAVPVPTAPAPIAPKAVGGGPPETTGQTALSLTNDAPANSPTQEEKPARVDSEKAAREALDKIAIMSVGTVRLDDRGTVICVPASSLFEDDGAELSAQAKDKLALVVDALGHSDGHAIVIEGYTSSHGDAAANRALAQRRAEAVRAHLVARGAPADRIRAQGLGGARPIADNET